MNRIYSTKPCQFCNQEFRPLTNSQHHCSLPCRFWDKVKIGRPNQCWTWIGRIAQWGNGYGHFDINHRPHFAHRISYELAHGMILFKKLFVCHHCDNPSCVNPNHLFLGTNLDNIMDATKKGRVSKGEKHCHAKLNEKDIIEIRKLMSKKIPRKFIMNKFNITSISYLYQIKNQKTWKHI